MWAGSWDPPHGNAALRRPGSTTRVTAAQSQCRNLRTAKAGKRTQTPPAAQVGVTVKAAQGGTCMSGRATGHRRPGPGSERGRAMSQGTAGTSVHMSSQRGWASPHAFPQPLWSGHSWFQDCVCRGGHLAPLPLHHDNPTGHVLPPFLPRPSPRHQELFCPKVACAPAETPLSLQIHLLMGPQ